MPDYPIFKEYLVHNTYIACTFLAFRDKNTHIHFHQYGIFINLLFNFILVIY